jgi:hypothetical protein
MSDIVKKEPTSIDNFTGWEDGVEGDDRSQGAGIIQGTLIKFTNEATWVTRDGGKLSADLELVVVDLARVVQKWRDQMPVETIILEPHQLFPNVAEMNAKVPKEEWVKGQDGELYGGWQAQHIAYALDLETMDKYTYPTGTNGGRRAIRDLRDKLVWMRKLRGANVYPVVTLSDTFMPTQFGGRQRPHFVIKRWVRLGGEGSEVPALSPPTQAPVDQPTRQATAELPLQEVKEPTLKEELNDEIPFNDPTPDLGKAESPSVPPLPNPRRNLKNLPGPTSSPSKQRKGARGPKLAPPV